jgi:hypothetical protein
MTPTHGQARLQSTAKTPSGVRPGAKPIRIVHHDPVAVYAFNDLVGRAREAALEWLRRVNTGPDCLETWRESCWQDLSAMGFTLRTQRNRRCFWYSLSYSQGDYVNFDASLDLCKLAAFDVAAYAPKGDLPTLNLKDQADLRALLELDPDASLVIEARRNNGWPTATLRADTEDEDLENHVSQALTTLVRDLCAAFRRSGYAELDYLWSEQTCIETAQANDYTFTATGQREG